MGQNVNNDRGDNRHRSVGLFNGFSVRTATDGKTSQRKVNYAARPCPQINCLWDTEYKNQYTQTNEDLKMDKYTAVPISEWDGVDYGDNLRIVNPRKGNPERIEYRMSRDVNNLPAYILIPQMGH